MSQAEQNLELFTQMSLIAVSFIFLIVAFQFYVKTMNAMRD